MPAIFLTDMSRCLPQSALAKTLQPNHWQTARYESGQVSGTMILVGGLSNAPDVAYPLELEGWHAIHVGYATVVHGETVAVKVRLAGDPCFTTIEDKEPDGLEVVTLREVFWKYADLTGEDIVFGQRGKGVEPGMAAGIGRPGGVAYVKLDPLSEARIECVRADRADARTRKDSSPAGRVSDRLHAQGAPACERSRKQAWKTTGDHRDGRRSCGCVSSERL